MTWHLGAFGGFTRKTLLTCILLVATPSLGSPQGFLDKFRDPEDGKIDTSEWMALRHGFLPLFTLVTEPAVGYGVALALAFFHRPEGWALEGAREDFRAGRRQAPPSITTPAGFYSFNGSWAAGLGHMGIWRDDRIRYQGSAGYGSFGLTVGVSDRDLSYTMEGWGLRQEIAFRISDLDLFWGLGYRLASSTVTFDTLGAIPELNVPSQNFRTAGLGAALIFDNRNNTFTPDRGAFLKAQLARQDELFGGQENYWSGQLSGLVYAQALPSLVLGLRLEGLFAQEDAPFWDLPSVGMRGIPAMKYLGQRVGLLEGEVRWDFKTRWSLVGFGGAGGTKNTILESEEPARWVGAGGAGFRYLLARAFGLRAGVDVAYGDSSWSWYIVMGSAWLRL